MAHLSTWRLAFPMLAFLAPSALAEAQERPTETLSLTVPGTAAPENCALLTPQQAAQPITLTRTFVDEFETLDLTDRWSPHYDGGYDPATNKYLGYDWKVKRTLTGNQEQEIYVDPGYKGTAKQPLGLNPFVLNDGILSIVADRIPADLRQYLYGYEYMSGLLTSRKSLVQTYGYFEMRAKVPTGKAMWPAFWLLPEDKSWPPEVDVMEIFGESTDIAATVHYLDGTSGAQSAKRCRGLKVPTASEEFHIYGALWTKERMTFFIDRVAVADVVTPSTLNKPMYMLLNLAVGGKGSVGFADAQTPLPREMQVDWVAAYRLN